MKKTITRILSLALACVMMLACGTTAFAAEPDNTRFSVVDRVVLGAMGENEIIVSPMQQNDEITFAVGSTGYMSNCGLTPKFYVWITGGSASTQVKVNFVTSGGVSYGPFGPLKADGSNMLDKAFVVVKGNGAWQFTANVTAGDNNGKLVVHVRQYY